MTKYRDIWVDLAILTLIVLTYTLTGAGAVQQVNRNADLPVYSSSGVRGVAVEVAVSGELDAGELCELAETHPLSVFVCGDTQRRCPGAVAELSQRGLCGGLYDCGEHECEYGSERVLMGAESRYTGDGGLRWSVDADRCADLAEALFNGCIVKTTYTGAEDLKKTLNIIGASGYNMIHLNEMI